MQASPIEIGLRGQLVGLRLTSDLRPGTIL